MIEFPKMSVDIHLGSVDIQLGLVTLLMTVLGGAVSATTLRGKRIKGVLFAAFIGLGGWGIHLVIDQSRETERSSQALSGALDGMTRWTQEIVRVRGVNAELENRLLAQGKTIAAQTEENIGTVMGGNTFCYVMLTPAQNGWVMDLVRVGKYAVRDLDLKLFDNNIFQSEMKRMRPDISAKRLSPMDAMQRAELNSTKTFGVKSFAVDDKLIGGYPYPDNDSQDFSMTFGAFNGVWIEQLSARKVMGKWLQSLYVEGESGGQPIDWNKIEAGFPLVDGKFPGWPVPNPGSKSPKQP
jgi:hypothetical protein